MGATSIMELGSVTKTFTAALLAMAYNSSLVTPSQNPASLVDTLTNGNLVGAGCSPPPSPSPVPSAAYGVMATMTLSMLATHTSGLPDTPPGEDGLSERSCYSPNQLVAFVESYPSPSPAPTPPHPWLYSNVGFGTIGYVVQGAYKQDWFVLLKQKILTPLAMSSTYNVDAVPSPAAQGYDCGGTKAVAHWSLDPWTAAGSLRSTLPDMMKYLAAAMQQTGTPASISQAMATAQTPVTGAFTDEGAPQAMAWAIPTPSAVPMISKDGATNGFNSWIGMIAPTTGTPAVGVVVLTNRAPVVDPSADPSCAAFAGSPADRIGMYILSHLH